MDIPKINIYIRGRVREPLSFFFSARIGFFDDVILLNFGESSYEDVNEMDWADIAESLNINGYAHLSGVLGKDECLKLQHGYPHHALFRSVIDMKRYRYGNGEYKYFAYPLPDIVQNLRTCFYRPLAKIANEWMDCLQLGQSYPPTHEAFLEVCAASNQTRPTPLILRYEAAGYNTLHRDLYGEVYFPFQIVFVLTEPEKDHHGGELVFVEQIPRAQSSARVWSPRQGDCIIFTTNFRPVKGTKGYYRAAMKHGVSKVTAGVRYSLGIIFHDAA